MTFISGRIRTIISVFTFAALLTGTVILGTEYVSANHPVLVEGNCLGDGAAQRTLVPPGTCGDYDGDGRIGSAEDNDAPFDRVFGTINAANSAAGAANNGSITIVASGTFPEVVTITGNVVLQAAPGVNANIDAVVQGDPGSGARQGSPGIIVNAPANRYVVIRNIQSRNWTSGIQINGNSRVAIQNSKFENNVNYGIEVTGNAKVTISNTEVHASGFRQSPAGDFPTTSAPNPGKGIEFDDDSSGSIFGTTVSGSFAAGISDQTSGGNSSSFGQGGGNRRSVCVFNSNVFDNQPNFENVRPSILQCGSTSRGDNDFFPPPVFFP